MQNYERLSHTEHILKRPDTYIGTLAHTRESCWIRDGSKFGRSNIDVSPGLVKIFDELLVNAIDQYSLHPKKMKRIQVNIIPGGFQVINHGIAIPIKKHTKEKIWIPELIFGHLLTSSNYDDTEQRVTGGRNGYGAKLANVFSNKFEIKLSDGKQVYTQRWSGNMSRVDEPVILEKKEPVIVQVTCWPDIERFGGFSDFAKIAEKRTWDAAMWCSHAQIEFNGSVLSVNSLEDFARMHLGDVSMACMQDICVGRSTSGGFEQVSFVNGIVTTKGGTHVDKVVSTLVAELLKDKRISTLKPAQIKSTLFVFVRAVIPNPTFSSQTKAECTSKLTEPIEFKPKFIKDVMGCGILDDLVALSLARTEKELKKTDGSKKSRITGIPKLDDANWAGTHKSHECTLIVTEGDSAKALAISGLSVVGRNAYGVFPLRGKPRNVRDVSVKTVTENEEFSAIKKILGLQHGKVYTSLRELRYGRLMIMTDADLDGSHIKGLVLNMFHVYWPKLIELGFLVSMVTPVIKAGKLWFFTEDEFRQAQPSGAVKYYKGLGTSTSSEAREYFKMIDRLTVVFNSDSKMNESMTLAFSKARADDRKVWLAKHMAEPAPGIPYGHLTALPVTDFVYRDLANFSAEDIKRSIPHVSDGFKPSQRKVIYASLKKNLVSDMKVAQLSGYIAEHTAYHHGEASLQGTIINLAQTFVGSNNVNLLEPSGQFGTRLAGGKDAASPRYIFTRLSPVTRKIFDPADSAVLKYVTDDGRKVEPEFYAPVVPMVLVNGAEGIGTGFSCYVPPYDLEVLKHNLRCAFDQVAMAPMVPFFKGFRGTTKKTKDHTWVLSGLVEQEGSQLRVTELPPGKWIQDFKEHLDGLVEKGVIQRFENHSTENTPDFRIWGAQTLEDPVRDLGLTRTIHTSNMYLVGPQGAVKKYESPEEILVDYVEIRIGMYKKRKAWLLKELDAEILWLSEKARFIRGVSDESIPIMNAPLQQIQNRLKTLHFSEDIWSKLLDIKTYQYTKEEVERLLALCERHVQERDQLKKTSAIQLWKNNLNDL